MDYKDYQAVRSDFWFQAKKNLLSVLMNMVSRGVAYQRLKILNVGAGTGDDLELLKRFGDVYVTDIDSVALSLVPKHLCVDIQVADLCKLPYEDEMFDVVVSLDVFEHISNDVKAVSEAHRILKPGGFLVFDVPAFQCLWSARDVALEHKRRYSKKMLKKLFSVFSSKYVNYWNFMLFIPVSSQRLLMRHSEPRVESIELPKFLNALFYCLMKFDTLCVKHRIPLPLGISLVGWCRK